jgi:hypothetical protein
MPKVTATESAITQASLNSVYSMNSIGRHTRSRYAQGIMPDKETIERAQEDEREGKSPSTQAGEFVREEMHHIREGKHGAASPQQAIAIGLSKARRAGVKLETPENAPAKVREQAARDSKKGASGKSSKPSRKRSAATLNALKREGKSAASKSALAKQGRRAASKRSAAARSQAAKKAVRTRKAEGAGRSPHRATNSRSQSRRAA